MSYGRTFVAQKDTKMFRECIIDHADHEPVGWRNAGTLDGAGSDREGHSGMDSMTEGKASRLEVGRQRSVTRDQHERHDGRWRVASGRHITRRARLPRPILLFPSALPATMALDSAPSQDVSVGTSKQAFSLENILGDDHENIEHPATATNEASGAASGWDEEAGQEHIALGFCVECEGASRR